MAVAQSVPTTYWYDDASDFFYDWILVSKDERLDVARPLTTLCSK
jgi:hypothetical protein